LDKAVSLAKRLKRSRCRLGCQRHPGCGMWARLGPRNYVLDGGKYGSVNGHFSTLREMYSLARPGLLAVIACIWYNHCSSQGEQRCERWLSYRSSLFLLSRGQDVLSVACVLDLHSACICSECQLCVKACTLLTTKCLLAYNEHNAHSVGLASTELMSRSPFIGVHWPSFHIGLRKSVIATTRL